MEAQRINITKPKMNMKRNKKPLSSLLSLLPSPRVLSLSWVSKLKHKISNSRFKKNQESFQALNWDKPNSFPKKMDLNRHKRKECKQNAIKDTKEKKTNNMAEETKCECSKGLDRFAVVRSSMDPQKDFKDSMVEMIREKGICRAGELEELLACYLTLNRDEYHDLIVQVLRDIWFELLQGRASRIKI